MSNLTSKRVALLATHGFEQSELLEPKRVLEEAGAKTDIVSLQKGKIRSWNDANWGDDITVDVMIADARPDDYDALVLPGGVMNPDHLRREPLVQVFVRAFEQQKKPIAAICHGAWTLIDSGVARGRRLTSYHTLQEDLKNAGAEWLDAEVVVDDNLITSRNPGDLPAFNKQLLEALSTETSQTR